MWTAHAAAEARRNAGQIARGIDIGERGCAGDLVAGEIARRVGKGMAGRPAHSPKRINDVRPPPHTDEPVAAILGRAEDNVAAPEQAEGTAHMGHLDIGNVGADDANGTRRQDAHGPLHAAAQIAAALRHSRQRCRPDAGCHCGIRRHGDDRLPERLARKPADQRCRRMPVERSRAYHTGFACEPRLDGARHRHLRHDHETATERRRGRRPRRLVARCARPHAFPQS